jgi:3-hydroxy acid dehydrogenase/malonic semialdehyde reductase
MTETEFSLKRFKGDTNKADAVYAGANPLQADDIAETVYWCASQPEHVNINSLEIMPQRQSFGPLAVDRS